MKVSRHVSALIMIIALIMTSCSSVKVAVDQEKNTDFSKYKTYSFLGWQNKSDKILSDADKGYLRDAFIHQFERRGLQKVNSGGDMEISLYIVLSEETAVSGYNDYVGGRGYSYHYGYGTGNMNNTFTQAGKEVGTLIMSVYDGNNREQIWQAIASSAVETNYEKRERSIPSKISKLMSYFPVKPK